MRRLTLLLLSLLLLAQPVLADSNHDEEASKDILRKALKVVLNPGGASMNYQFSVSVIHKSGYIIFKGNKFQRRSKRTIDWFNGKTFWTMNRSSQVVKISELKKTTDDDDAGLTRQFEKVLHGWKYTLVDEQSAWRIKIRLKDPKAKIKNAEVLINKITYAPMQLRIKYGLFWVNIKLTNFKTANYSDVNFYFDPAKYPNATIIDKR